MADLSVALRPDHITAVKDKFSTTIVPFENESEQRFPNDHVGESEWELSWILSESLLASLRSFFRSQLGAFRRWTINDSRIGPTDVYVRFVQDELQIKPIKFKAFNVKVNIKTC